MAKHVPRRNLSNFTRFLINFIETHLIIYNFIHIVFFLNFRALCDIKQSGKLNNEQFALAMWFVARCLKGTEPPATLTPEMIPPSFRTVTKSTDGLVVSFFLLLFRLFDSFASEKGAHENIENRSRDQNHSQEH